MGEAAGLGLLWFVFIGWLMWSSKSYKETFLFYTWGSMIVLGVIGMILQMFGVAI